MPVSKGQTQDLNLRLITPSSVLRHSGIGSVAVRLSASHAEEVTMTISRAKGTSEVLLSRTHSTFKSSVLNIF